MKRTLGWITLLLLASAVSAVTVTEGTRTVQSKNFLIRWSQADQEAIVSLQWDAGGSPAGAPNLTASANVGACPAPFAPEYFGNSWTGGSPQSGEPVLAGLGTSTPAGEEAWTPVFGEHGSEVSSQSNDYFPPFMAAGVPLNTRYRFYDNKPRGSVIRLDRTFGFGEEALSMPFRPYIPRLSRSAGLDFDAVKYPTSSGTLATVSVDVCPFGCIRSDWSAARNWLAIHSPATGRGVILKRADNGFAPELFLDWDGSSNTNATSFRLRPPAGGFTEEVTERMVLCFYDASTWTAADQQALRLPAGCSVD
jgi:hypothetical protein